VRQGRLFCTGNSLSLKAEYGVGYRLVAQPTPGRELELLSMIQEFVPDGEQSVRVAQHTRAQLLVLAVQW
jgi:hypothetical protein